MSSANRVAAYRARLREQGRCVWCAKPNDSAHTYCTACRATADARREQRKVERALTGKCRRCDRVALPGMASCETHAESDRKHGSKRRRRAGKPMFACSACGERGHYRTTCKAMSCECGQSKNPADVACASCTQLDLFRDKPVLRLLHEDGPADIYDIAARLGKKPNSVAVYLSRYEKQGVVVAERSGRDKTIWKLAEAA